MSLEQDIAQLTAETNGLLNEIRGQKSSIDRAAERFEQEAHQQIAAMERHAQAISYGVAKGEGSTITVGPKGRFKNLQQAWNHLANKVVRRRVTLQLEDGVHVYAGSFSFWNQPYAHMIRIRGNDKNPERCVLKFVHGKRAYPDSRVLINIGNSPGLVMSGFTLEGEFKTASGDWYHHGIRVHRGDLHLVSNTVRLKHLMVGIDAYYDAEIHAHRLISTHVGHTIRAVRNSTIYAYYLQHQGLGKDATIKYASGKVAAWNYTAVASLHHSRVFMYSADVKDVPYGFNCNHSSHLHCPGSQVTNAKTAFQSAWSAELWTGVHGKRLPTATNCDYGFRASGKSMLYVRRGVAQSCKFGYSVETQSFMDANYSRALKCTHGFYAHTMSLIEAWGTVKASTGNKTPYSPAAHGQLTNDHSRIRRS